MRSLQEALASMWETLNPTEPSPKYLAVFMGSAAVLFLLAIWVGHVLAA